MSQYNCNPYYQMKLNIPGHLMLLLWLVHHGVIWQTVKTLNLHFNSNWNAEQWKYMYHEVLLTSNTSTESERSQSPFWHLSMLQEMPPNAKILGKLGLINTHTNTCWIFKLCGCMESLGLEMHSFFFHSCTHEMHLLVTMSPLVFYMKECIHTKNVEWYQ